MYLYVTSNYCTRKIFYLKVPEVPSDDSTETNRSCESWKRSRKTRDQDFESMTGTQDGPHSLRRSLGRYDEGEGNNRRTVGVG